MTMTERKSNMENKKGFDRLLHALNAGKVPDLVIDKDLDDEQFKQLCETLKGNTTVRNLSFKCLLTNNKLALLGEALQRCPTLSTLTLADSIVESTDAFIKFLDKIKDVEALKSLNLKNMGYADYWMDNQNRVYPKLPKAKDQKSDKDTNIPMARFAGEKLLQALPNILEESHLEKVSLSLSPDHDEKKFVENMNQGAGKKLKEQDRTPIKPLKKTGKKRFDVGSQGEILVHDSVELMLSNMVSNDPQRPTVLDLSNSTLNANEIQAIERTLLNPNSKVLSLNLEGAKVDIESFTSLLKVLAQYPNINELNLNNLKFSVNMPNASEDNNLDFLAYNEELIAQSKPLREVFKALAGSTVIRKLYLANLGDAFRLEGGLSSFFDGLMANQAVSPRSGKPGEEGSKLFQLDLSGIRAPNVDDKEKQALLTADAAKIAEYCATSSTLEILNISGRSDLSLTPILQALASNPNSQLRHLIVDDRTLTHEDLKSIAKILSKGKLTKLSLSNCSLDPYIDILTTAFAQNNSLEELNLSQNSIGTSHSEAVGYPYHEIISEPSQHGLNAICRALSENPNSALTTLDLSDNSIGIEDYEPVVTMLNRNKQLQHLNLGNNNILEVAKLAQGLANNHSLLTLNIRGNPLASAEGKASQEARLAELEINKCLLRNQRELQTEIERDLEPTNIQRVFLSTFEAEKQKRRSTHSATSQSEQPKPPSETPLGKPPSS